ncbi:MAG TPA: nucleotide disphospho-sugar-binding domain-containing protein [Polyangiaceae bacterium]|nr:nucleotide disphospho-sugar-binding domain-containing protein [Polyangiaceae bacterium]
MKRDRMRILFVSENVTLAQVVRLVTLARALDPEQFEIHFACSEFPALCFSGTAFTQHVLYTLEPRAIDKALRSGRRLYERSTLERYVKADLELLARVKPALVVSDLRLSLTISAPLHGVRHAALINAYWSPSAARDGFPLPEHPIVRLLGEKIAARYFPKALPTVFRYFAEPVNRLRKQYGLSPIGDLLAVLDHADFILYPDIPELTPVTHTSARHVFLGPVLWSPAATLPPEWTQANAHAERTPVYATLGSSGDVSVLPTVVRALGRLPLSVLLATARRAELHGLPPNIRRVDFAPGDEAARRSAFVITNGGSSSGYQALAEGTPVLGIPFNLDQYLAMDAIAKAGAGVLLRAGSLTERKLEDAVQKLLAGTHYREAAARIAARMKSTDSADSFRNFVARAIAEPALHARAR